jgi:hypothetical protein
MAATYVTSISNEGVPLGHEGSSVIDTPENFTNRGSQVAPASGHNFTGVTPQPDVPPTSSIVKSLIVDPLQINLKLTLIGTSGGTQGELIGSVSLS